MNRPLRIAVVGAGPSGLYATEALVGQADVPIVVDVIDRLPCPFGLVRYGVAPDHLSIRSVRDKLAEVFEHPGVRFLGNVEVGRDVSLDELREAYDAIVLTYGASRDRAVGIPGEDLPGSIAATDLVMWYTGHPDVAPDAFTGLLAGSRSVAVLGLGNVAVDVTRVLAKTPEEIEHTDMPEHVFAALRGSGVRDIHVVGRRGPAQATWTTKELRELGELADCDVLVPRESIELDPASRTQAEGDKAVGRNVAVIREWAEREPRTTARRIHLHFLAQPVAIEGDDRVTGLVIERTVLDEAGRAVSTGERTTIPVDAVIRSVGYRGTPLDGVPFDHAASVIPHVDGRVMDGGAIVPGLYVAGWIKRGPTGIIGTNKKDAAQTVASLLADAASGALSVSGGAAGIDALLAGRGIEVVDAAGWKRIDAAERARGAAAGRDRSTVHERSDMLAAARGSGAP